MSGSSNAVSRTPGAPPWIAMDATSRGRTRTAVTPEATDGSWALPARTPATSVIRFCKGSSLSRVSAKPSQCRSAMVPRAVTRVMLKGVLPEVTMLFLRCLLAGFLALGFGIASVERSLAERRVALVVGNSAYVAVPHLSNPANDARAMAQRFRDARFDAVDLVTDATGEEFRRALREFTRKSLDADLAVVFYAGHGVEIGGTNYVIPVDAKLTTDLDVEDEAIGLDRIVRALEPARKLKLIIVDACRENPFVPTMRRVSASRAVERGLGRVEVDGADTLIAFAAKAGSTAADGTEEGHSPFTKALLDHLLTPGLDVRLALGKVRDDVLKATGNRQEPYVYGSLGGSFIALAPVDTPVAPAPAPTPPAVPAGPVSADQCSNLFAAARSNDTVRAYEAYLKKCPDDLYSEMATAAIARLDNMPAAGTEPAPPSPPSTVAPLPPSLPVAVEPAAPAAPAPVTSTVAAATPPSAPPPDDPAHALPVPPAMSGDAPAAGRLAGVACRKRAELRLHARQEARRAHRLSIEFAFGGGPDACRPVQAGLGESAGVRGRGAEAIRGRLARPGRTMCGCRLVSRCGSLRGALLRRAGRQVALACDAWIDRRRNRPVVPVRQEPVRCGDGNLRRPAARGTRPGARHGLRTATSPVGARREGGP